MSSQLDMTRGATATLQRDTARKVFLQWMFSERLVELSAAEALFEKLRQEMDEDGSNFDEFFDYCHGALAPFDLKMQRMIYVDQNQRTEYIGICNLNSDSIAQVATRLSVQEIQIFKGILQHLRSSRDHEMTLSEAAESGTSLPKGQLLQFLQNLVSDGWLFYRSVDGRYSLGPRSVLELGDYLRGRMQESEDPACDAPVFEDCALCSNLIAKGVPRRCLSAQCGSAFHSCCLASFIATVQVSQCPKCRGEVEAEAETDVKMKKKSNTK